jgi:hypothetical protein
MTKNESGEILIGNIEFNEAKRIKSALAEKNVHLRLAAEPHVCSSKGCKITVEVYSREEDLPVVSQYFQEARARELDGLNVNLELLGSAVFDVDQETTQCPACGTSFRTTEKACPDCGLVFINDEMM